MNCRLLWVSFAIVAANLPISEMSAQGKQNRLRTMFTGADKCADIINDGQNNRLQMADCGNFSGQLWSITKTP